MSGSDKVFPGYGKIPELNRDLYKDSFISWIYEDDFELDDGYYMVVSDRATGEFYYIYWG